MSEWFLFLLFPIKTERFSDYISVNVVVIICLVMKANPQFSSGYDVLIEECTFC